MTSWNPFKSRKSSREEETESYNDKGLKNLEPDWKTTTPSIAYSNLSDIPEEDSPEAIVVYGNKKHDRKGIKQLMYQIPMRRSQLDRDYVIFSGYRFQPKSDYLSPSTHLNSIMYVATDTDVDFVDAKPLQLTQGIRLLKPITKVWNNLNVHLDNDNGKRLEHLFNDSLYHSSEICNSWKCGDKVEFSDTKELVEILERGLKGNDLMVKIRYLSTNESSDLVLELPLLELMAIGTLVT